MKFRVVSFCLLWFLINLLGAQDEKIPNYTGLVNDFAQVLNQSEIADLTSKLRKLEDTTSTQIAIVTENSLNGKEAYERAIQIARTWGIGQKDKNNGVLIYLSITDRKYYILNANKTQGKLTDGLTGEIGRNFLVPYLKQIPPNYYQGFQATLNQLAKALNGEFTADPKKEKGIPLWAILLIIVILVLLFSRANGGGPHRGYRNTGTYWFPVGGFNGGGGSSNWGGGGSSSWGGFGGGGGFDGGGAGGSW